MLARIIYSCLFCLEAIGQINPLAAQPKYFTEAESELAAKINCGDFKRTSQGAWASGPNAKIGNMVFSNNYIQGHGIMISGADLVAVLEKKCGGQPL